MHLYLVALGNGIGLSGTRCNAVKTQKETSRPGQSGSRPNRGARSSQEAMYQVITVVNASKMLQNAAELLLPFVVTMAIVGTNNAAELMVNAINRMAMISCIFQAIRLAEIPIRMAKPILR